MSCRVEHKKAARGCFRAPQQLPFILLTMISITECRQYYLAKVL